MSTVIILIIVGIIEITMITISVPVVVSDYYHFDSYSSSCDHYYHNYHHYQQYYCCRCLYA